MNAIESNSLIGRTVRVYCGASNLLDKLQPILLLGFRLYVARVFFMSALTKIHDWSITVALFTDECHVPVLSPAVAALLGTTTELSMPVLLALGLATRLGAALPDIAVKDHILWGTMLVVVLLFGPGKISLDRLLDQRVARRTD